jgi:hypothetical protein
MGPLSPTGRELLDSQLPECEEFEFGAAQVKRPEKTLTLDFPQLELTPDFELPQFS